MSRYYGVAGLQQAWHMDPNRPVKRYPATPTGDAAVDGFTRYARRSVYDAPGTFRSAEDADRMDKLMADIPTVNDA